MLAMADGEVSEPEDEKLAVLAGRLRLTSITTESIQVWVHDFSELLERFGKLLGTVEP